MQDKGLKVIQFVDSYYPHIDGVVKVVDNYAKTLNSMGDSCIVCTPNCGKHNEVFPYRVLTCPSLPTGTEAHPALPELQVKMRREVLSYGADIIHSHSPFMMGRYGLKMARKLGVPYVTTFHSKFYDDFLAYTHSKRFAEFGVRYILKLYNNADAVWAVNNGTAETLRSYGFKGEIGVMPNGVDCDCFYPDDPEKYISAANEAYPLPCDGLKILFVGQLIWQKNHKLVLDTVALLTRQGIPVSLTVAGAGDHGKAIMAYADKLGISSRVAYVGRVTKKELLQGLYLRSDLFFFPSMYDNAPITLQEASLNRVPALLLRGSNAAECIRDRENGYLTADDPAEAAEVIKSIIADLDGNRQMGINASQSIVNRWEDILVDVRAAYVELINKVKRDKGI
ncbi:MAG: glycosyltransferase [Clostridia bacterium]|nr:glycosyltransferase [Clostridia bacterium]